MVFITYNHEKYVAKALESVLFQETDFDYEIMVGEDCSTDETGNIVREYRDRYPDIIRIYPRDENTGRPTLNVYETTVACRGKYLAYLEGDDYWTDTKKLQKQVTFLEEHDEYIACTHSCRMVDENGEGIVNEEILSVGGLYDWSGRFTFNDFERSARWPGHYATLVSRNIYLKPEHDYTILYRAHDFVDDGVILTFLLMQGDIYRMDDEMSAWRYVRKTGAGNWNSISMTRDTKKDDCYLSQTLMKWLEGEKGLDDYAPVIAEKNFEYALSRFIKHPGRDNWQFVRDMYKYGISHVVLKDKRSTLFRYCMRTIRDKFMQGA